MKTSLPSVTENDYPENCFVIIRVLIQYLKYLDDLKHLSVQQTSDGRRIQRGGKHFLTEVNIRQCRRGDRMSAVSSCTGAHEKKGHLNQIKVE